VLSNKWLLLERIEINPVLGRKCPIPTLGNLFGSVKQWQSILETSIINGKTRAITHRIGYLVLHDHIAPWNILAVTFTNKAAREMRERLFRLLGGSRAKTMTICTFHSLCARVLRQEPDYLSRYGMTTTYSILSQTEQLRVVKQAIGQVDISDINMDQQHAPKPADILQAISRAKSRMLSPEQMADQATKEVERLAARVFPLYNKLLRLSNACDFDDLLRFVEHLWRSQPERLSVYQRRWQYIHVDEFQDCNLPQYKLIRLLGYGTNEQHLGLGNVCAPWKTQAEKSVSASCPNQESRVLIPKDVSEKIRLAFSNQ